MKNDDLAQWEPCQSYCQMAGAAAALLSFKDACAVVNGPRWCSVIAERELSQCHADYTPRLFCSQIEQCDLLFGTDTKIKSIIRDVNASMQNVSLLGVITSCAISLIGDDLNGIVKSMHNKYPVLLLDSGGLKGEFFSGYQEAMLAILQQENLQVQPVDHLTVNLLGYCSCFPQSEGDLLELKRLLTLAGYKIGVCLGADGLTRENLQTIPKAALNIVLAPELAADIANYLQTVLHQPFIVLVPPCGCAQSLAWLEKIGQKLGVKPNLSLLLQETVTLEKSIAEQYLALKNEVKKLFYKRALIVAPYSQAMAFKTALQKSIFAIPDICTSVQGPYGIVSTIPGPEAAAAERNTNLRDYEYQILMGTERDRSKVGNYLHTVYLNCLQPDSKIHVAAETFLGIQGWATLAQQIFFQTKLLHKIAIDMEGQKTYA